MPLPPRDIGIVSGMIGSCNPPTPGLPYYHSAVSLPPQDYHTIMNKMVFSKLTDFVYSILDHEYVSDVASIR